MRERARLGPRTIPESMEMLYGIEVGGGVTRVILAYDGCYIECATLNRAVGVVASQYTVRTRGSIVIALSPDLYYAVLNGRAFNPE